MRATNHDYDGHIVVAFIYCGHRCHGLWQLLFVAITSNPGTKKAVHRQRQWCITSGRSMAGATLWNKKSLANAKVSVRQTGNWSHGPTLW